ncbi:GNAT family N-acetyltransferase [Pluralibacter gergoviae]|uniref:GNAT family N-acetyltransferase n=1 Tax=Pluralibacter gergoviae TaxID=61647 RepID=UPI003EE0E19E
MNEYQIIVSDEVSAGDLLVIENGLNRFNDQHTGVNDRMPLSVVIKDPATGETLGGILGRSSLGLLFIDLVYLPSALRGKQLGSELLRRFENEGRKRGCLSAVLYTISFQAPEFYRKHGWQEFGRIDCAPEGTSRIFMTKTL